MDLHSFALPAWLPWWAVVAVLVPIALYLALFLLMPFHTFGLRARLAGLEARLDEIQGEIRALTLRLPEPGIGFDGAAPRGGFEGAAQRGGFEVAAQRGRAPPPIPPAVPEAGARGGFGDPVADRMLAYMRDKAQADVKRADVQRANLQLGGQPVPRPRTEPRMAPRPLPDHPLPEPAPLDRPLDGPPPPPRLPLRFGRHRTRPGDES